MVQSLPDPASDCMMCLHDFPLVLACKATAWAYLVPTALLESEGGAAMSYILSHHKTDKHVMCYHI